MISTLNTGLIRKTWAKNANSVNRGKTRLAKWYAPYNDEEKIKLKGEVCALRDLFSVGLGK